MGYVYVSLGIEFSVFISLSRVSYPVSGVRLRGKSGTFLIRERTFGSRGGRGCGGFRRGFRRGSNACESAGGESISKCRGDGDSYAHAELDSHVDSYFGADRDGLSVADFVAESDVHSETDSNPNRHADCDVHTQTDTYAHADTYSYSVVGAPRRRLPHSSE